MCENRRLAIYLQLPQGEAIQEFSCENRNKTTAKRLDINPGPGGGHSSMIWVAGVPLRLEKLTHFYTKFCQKMRPIFIPEPQI